MSRIAKAAMLTATAGVALAGSAGVAAADAGAQGIASNSPGVLSGNLIQVPVHVPINVCGNTVNIIGVLNPALGNQCVNTDGDNGDHGKDNGKDKHEHKHHNHGK